MVSQPQLPQEEQEEFFEEEGLDGTHIRHAQRMIRRVPDPVPVVAAPHEHVSDVGGRTVVERAPWSPAQFIALGAGVLFIVFGALTLALGGISDIYNPVTFGPFSRTPLMGLIELGYGILMLAIGSIPGIDRGGMTLIGVIALAWGIVVVALPANQFYNTLGLRNADGWLYVIVGGLLLVVAAAAPVFMGTGRVFKRVHRQDH
ncbi:MAG: hypothetical protein EXR67_02225 [Dehalococcoidia bacterium]|nr:hypothetical protein [Dehalococcoidia bacterium]